VEGPAIYADGILKDEGVPARRMPLRQRRQTDGRTYWLGRGQG